MQENFDLTLDSLLLHLRDKKIQLDLKGEQIEVSDPNGNLTEDLIEIIKYYKQNIINLLKVACEDENIVIKKCEKKEYYALSLNQSSIYFLSKANPLSLNYNMPFAYLLGNSIRSDEVVDCLNNIINKHDSLRTCFIEVNGDPVQVIKKSVHFKCDYKKINKTDINDLMKSFCKPFDLNKPPLINACIYSMDDTNILFIDMHHIISDGRSIQIILEDFTKGLSNSEQELQYIDYSEWQNSKLYKQRLKKQESYWKEQRLDEVPILELPLDQARKKIRTENGGSWKYKLDDYYYHKLKEMNTEHGYTMFTSMLAIFNILLSKLGSQEEIIVGTPLMGRDQKELFNIVGLFVNTLPLRNSPRGSLPIIDFIAEVKNNVNNAIQNQNYPLDKIVREVVKERSLVQNPLFDIVISYEEITGQLSSPNHSDQNIEEESLTKFDLSLNVIESELGLELIYKYNKDLFFQTTISRFNSYLLEILHMYLDKPQTQIAEIDMLTENEKKQLLYEFNNTKGYFPQEKTVQALFDEQVEKNPNKVAFVVNDQNISYSELYIKSNQLAGLLRQRGVKPDMVVGIMLDRCIDLIIGILGIIKSGGSYLPIDPDNPQDRIEYMLCDSESVLILTQAAYQHPLSEIESIDISNHCNFNNQSGVLKGVNSPRDLIYVIYTSGSTGKPKGVMIQHNHVVNFIQAVTNEISFLSNDRLLSLTTISFDIFVLESVLPLCTGVTFVLGTKNIQLDESLLEVINNFQITILQITPSLLQLLLSATGSYKQNTCLKKLLVGGEPFHENILKKLNRLFSARIYNMYGPTETTVWSTIRELTGIDRVDIGKPILNTNVYILSKNLKLLPIGITGDLYISGEGVARGYFKKPDLTKERFIPNPYCKGELMYNTGDLARWLPDGNIECKGRVDDQVKIRGFRIELGEIETCIRKISGIVDAKVLLLDGIENIDNVNDAIEDSFVQMEKKLLCAYYITDKEITDKIIRNNISKELPYYMVPTHFIQMEEFPLMPSGKINKNVLPAPATQMKNDHIAPDNNFEITLVNIWSELLGIDNKYIGAHSNFFRLGGHSLLAAKMITKIRDKFGKTIRIADVFDYPTIADLAIVIENSNIKTMGKFKKSEKKEYYQLTEFQKRIFVFQILNPQSTNYNLPFFIYLKGSLNYKRLQNAFDLVIANNESLRTIFKFMSDGTIVQSITHHLTVDLNITELNGHSISKNTTEFIRPFDLENDLLFRVGILRIEENNHLLMIDAHHIIYDADSHKILLNELIIAYEDQELNIVKSQLRDYLGWYAYKLSKTKAAQMAYWQQEFFIEKTIVNFPFHNTLKVSKHQGRTVSFTIEREELNLLRALGYETNTSVNVIVLSVFLIFLSKISGQNKVCVGSDISGREENEFTNMIAPILNLILIGVEINPNSKFRELLVKIKDLWIQALDNQEYSYTALSENINKSQENNQLFNVMFGYQKNMYGEIKSELDNGKIKVEPYIIENDLSKFDLMLSCLESDYELFLEFEYRLSIFNEETVDILIPFFKGILKYAIDNKNLTLEEIHFHENHNIIDTDLNELNFEF